MANKASSKQGKHGKGHEKEFTEQLLGQPYIHKVIDWCTANLKIIGIVAGIIILLVVMILGWQSYTKSVNAKAMMLEGEAFKLHQEAKEQAASPPANEEETADPQNPYQEVIALYNEILDQYPRTESAERAMYLLGSIEYEIENYEQAREYFSAYIKKYPKGFLLTSAEESLGYIFEQEQAYQKALETFKGLENKVEASKKTEIQLAIARNYESLEQIDDAMATYQAIVDSNTSFSLKNQAKERLDILQAQQQIVSEEGTQQTPSTEVETTQDTMSPDAAEDQGEKNN